MGPYIRTVHARRLLVAVHIVKVQGAYNTGILLVVIPVIYIRSAFLARLLNGISSIFWVSISRCGSRSRASHLVHCPPFFDLSYVAIISCLALDVVHFLLLTDLNETEYFTPSLCPALGQDNLLRLHGM